MESAGLIVTDAGMHALWDRSHFAQVTDYDSWEPELLEPEDVERHIRAGHLVPLSSGFDAAWVVLVRASSTELPSFSDEEQGRVVVESDAYLLVSEGHVDVSGIEYVCSDPSGSRNVVSLDLPVGHYEVHVAVLDYDDIEQRSDEFPPDLVVRLGPARAGSTFRSSREPFELPID